MVTTTLGMCREMKKSGPEILESLGRLHPILYLSLRVVERVEVLPEFLETSDD